MKPLPPAMIAARKMPPLPHFLPGQSFDVMRSPAVAWLVAQPEIRQWLWNVAKADHSIVLDLKSGTWQGADYRGKP